MLTKPVQSYTYNTQTYSDMHSISSVHRAFCKWVSKWLVTKVDPIIGL